MSEVYHRVVELYHRCRKEIGDNIFIGVPIYYLEDLYQKEYFCHIIEDIYDETKLFIGFVLYLKLHPNTIILTQGRCKTDDNIHWLMIYDENDMSFERSLIEINKLQFEYEKDHVNSLYKKNK